MLKRFFLLALLSAAVFAIASYGQEKAVVRSQKAKAMLVGKHKFSLQWISWDYFGSASVTVRNGVYRLKGEQKGRGNGDFVTIDGIITEITEKTFVFKGTVLTQVSTINEGRPCTRDGEMTFRITGSRKYWRLQDIDNPCDAVADYVDIYFRR